MPRIADLPASKLIRFLTAYGPDDNNQNLFDENVQTTSAKNGIAAFDLETKDVPEIISILKGKEPVSVLIAGVAGDGKSYHLRKIWQALGGDPKSWQSKGMPGVEIALANGARRQVHFINDLSAYGEPFQTLWDQVSRADSGHAFVIACNHGQILTRLRELDDAGARSFADSLEEAFFRADSRRPFNHIHLFDLSRTSQSENLYRIIELICTQDGWDACVRQSCDYLQGCPIRENLKVLWNADENSPVRVKGSTQVTKRLCELVRLAAYDGAHIPVRELFLLTVNAIFGRASLPGKRGSRKSAGATADCHLVRRMRLNEIPLVEVSACRNLLGGNLGERARVQKSLFRRLDLFQVGRFGDPYFDNLILTGKNHPDPKKKALFEKYLSDLSPMPKESDDGMKDWNEYWEQRTLWLEDARRRLFFRWNEPDIHASVWSLTAYRHAEDFLKLREQAIEGSEQGSEPEEWLVEGLNRVFSGSPASENKANILITTNGAESRTPAGGLVVGSISAGYWNSDVRLRCSSGKADAVPVLEFYSQDVKPIQFLLTPRRYEFLAGIAEGLLPSSFSEQCQAEFYSLKATLIRPGTNTGRREIRLGLIDGKHISMRLEKTGEKEGRHA